MNRIASIATSLIIAILLLAGAASAQYNDHKIAATVPFDFVVGKITLPAGQYVFVRTSANTLTIRDVEGRGLFTTVTNTVQATKAPSTSNIRFANIAGSHVLIQVWNEDNDIGSELYPAHALLEEARYPAIHGSSAGRR